MNINIGILAWFCLLCAPASAGALNAGIWDESFTGLEASGNQFLGPHRMDYECIFRHSGIDLKILAVPHNRQVRMMEVGLLDIGIAWVPSKKNDEIGIMTKPVLKIPVVLLTTQPLKDRALSSHFRLATKAETGLEKMIVGLGALPEPVKSFSSAAFMVMHERVQGAILPEPSLVTLNHDLLNALNKKNVGSLDLTIYVSRSNPESQDILERLNVGIDLCQRNAL